MYALNTSQQGRHGLHCDQDGSLSPSSVQLFAVYSETLLSVLHNSSGKVQMTLVICLVWQLQSLQ